MCSVKCLWSACSNKCVNLHNTISQSQVLVASFDSKMGNGAGWGKRGIFIPPSSICISDAALPASGLTRQRKMWHAKLQSLSKVFQQVMLKCNIIAPLPEVQRKLYCQKDTLFHQRGALSCQRDSVDRRRDNGFSFFQVSCSCHCPAYWPIAGAANERVEGFNRT